jgi:hypothetical protein
LVDRWKKKEKSYHKLLRKHSLLVETPHTRRTKPRKPTSLKSKKANKATALPFATPPNSSAEQETMPSDADQLINSIVGQSKVYGEYHYQLLSSAVE